MTCSELCTSASISVPGNIRLTTYNRDLAVQGLCFGIFETYEHVESESVKDFSLYVVRVCFLSYLRTTLDVLCRMFDYLWAEQKLVFALGTAVFRLKYELGELVIF